MMLGDFSPVVGSNWKLGPGYRGLVTVVVPTYNRAALIAETLDSILAQRFRPIELLVVDDGSSDDTVRVVRSWVGRQQLGMSFVMRTLEQAHAGAPVARNRGVLESTGEFIQFLDSDDTLDPDKIRIQVETLAHDSDMDFAYGRVYDLETRQRLMYGHSEMSPKRMILKQIVNPAFTTPGPLCRRTMLEELGPWDERLPMCQDWEYHSRAAVLGFRGVFTPTASALVRQVSDRRLSWDQEPMRAEAWYFARSRQLGSMWFHATEKVRSDPEFRGALAWEVVLTSARAVKLGCKVDDFSSYITATNLCTKGTQVILLTFVRWVCGAVGPTVGANLILGLAWLKYRASGLRSRVTPLLRRIRGADTCTALYR